MRPAPFVCACGMELRCAECGCLGAWCAEYGCDKQVVTTLCEECGNPPATYDDESKADRAALSLISDSDRTVWVSEIDGAFSLSLTAEPQAVTRWTRRGSVDLRPPVVFVRLG